jgi:hypothetical protein
MPARELTAHSHGLSLLGRAWPGTIVRRAAGDAYTADRRANPRTLVPEFLFVASTAGRAGLTPPVGTWPGPCGREPVSTATQDSVAVDTDGVDAEPPSAMLNA